jgi:membrane protease YdiL (CAAX protease family)
MAVFFASNVIPELLLDRRPRGLEYALVGLVQAALVPLAIVLALRPVGIGLRDVGLADPLTDGWFRADALIGLGVAVAFATLQFGVVIPATGGAGRSDIVTNSAQIGGSLAGVVGFIVLAWTGAAVEELFFRGHFLTTLRNALGRSRAALAAAALVTVMVFAFLHGYQGAAGVIDAGMYGGALLTGLYLWRRGRLTACIVAHATWNSLAAVGIYLWYSV